MSINGPTSAEVRARLGLQPVNRPETMEERIERNFVTSMPEAVNVNPHDLVAEDNDPQSLLGVSYEER